MGNHHTQTKIFNTNINAPALLYTLKVIKMKIQETTSNTLLQFHIQTHMS